ncbi:MAG: DUF1573 domain-containing protein [Planctomycetota bacterium]|nr:DUF1573 domain-containing protein [Planctomycetota bacterium]
MRLLLLALFLTACTPSPPSGPPALVLAHEVLTIGEVPGDTFAVVRVPWRRTGAGTLRVLAVETDCGCAVAEGPRGDQPAGARGEIVVRVHGLRRAGPFAHRVTVYTDQRPPRDRVSCRLRGWTGRPAAFAPGALALGPRSPRASLTRDVELRLDPSVDAPDLTVRLTGVAGTASLLPPARPAVPGRLLLLELEAPAEPGPFTAQVELARGSRVLAVLPIRGRVRLPRRGPPGRGRPR